MKSNIYEAFETLTPTAEQKNYIYAGILSRADAEAPAPRFRVKKVFAAFAAAAALAVITVTASAVYNWDMTAAVRSFFGDRKNIAADSIAAAEVISSENTFKDLDIEVKGAVTDENFTVIFLDVTRKDGDIFDSKAYALTDCDGNDLNSDMLEPRFEFGSVSSRMTCAEGSVENLPLRVYTVRDGNDTDEHITQAVCINTGNFSACEKIRLTLSGLSGKKCYGTKVGGSIVLNSYSVFYMQGSYSCEIGLENCRTESRTVPDAGTTEVGVYTNSADPNKVEFGSYVFEAKNLTVTPISVSVRLVGEPPRETLFINTENIGAVVLKDGREIKFGSYTLPSVIREGGNLRSIPKIAEGDNWVAEASFILPETVEINEIQAVRLGNTEFSIN